MKTIAKVQGGQNGCDECRLDPLDRPDEESPTNPTETFWVTRYYLSRGLYSVEASIEAWGKTQYAIVPTGTGRDRLTIGEDAFEDKDKAIAACEALVKAHKKPGYAISAISCDLHRKLHDRHKAYPGPWSIHEYTASGSTRYRLYDAQGTPIGQPTQDGDLLKAVVAARNEDEDEVIGELLRRSAQNHADLIESHNRAVSYWRSEVETLQNALEQRRSPENLIPVQGSLF